MKGENVLSYNDISQNSPSPDNSVVEASDKAPKIQETIHAFVSANISHRKVIERWATDAGMHRSQHRMLLYLSKQESSPSQKELAERFEISPAAVAVTLKKLEADGYIERGKRTEIADSRYNEIRITEQGRQATLQSRKYFQHVDAEAFRNFSDEELDTLKSLLERMKKNLRDITPPANDENQQ